VALEAATDEMQDDDHENREDEDDAKDLHPARHARIVDSVVDTSLRRHISHDRLKTGVLTYIRAMPPAIQIVQITLQALSAFAIAAGVLYTAVQLRQARKSQVVANFAKLVELQYDLRKLRVEHPSLAAVHKHDVEHLHSDREIQEYYLSLMQLSLFEIAWYAHQQEQLPDDYFQSWAKRMWQVGRDESFRRMLENPSMKIMHDDFDTYVRALLRSPTPP
jgi:hypothetical protein